MLFKVLAWKYICWQHVVKCKWKLSCKVVIQRILFYCIVLVSMCWSVFRCQSYHKLYNSYMQPTWFLSKWSLPNKAEEIPVLVQHQPSIKMRTNYYCTFKSGDKWRVARGWQIKVCRFPQQEGGAEGEKRSGVITQGTWVGVWTWER